MDARTGVVVVRVDDGRRNTPKGRNPSEEQPRPWKTLPKLHEDDARMISRIESVLDGGSAIDVGAEIRKIPGIVYDIDEYHDSLTRCLLLMCSVGAIITDDGGSTWKATWI